MKLNTCGTCKYFCKEIEGFSCLACKQQSLYVPDEDVILEMKTRAYLKYIVKTYQDLSVDELLKKVLGFDYSKVYLANDLIDLARTLLAEDAKRMGGTDFFDYVEEWLDFKTYSEKIIVDNGGAIVCMETTPLVNYYLDTSE